MQPDKIMIGDIMLVIPGLQLTNSLRDMIKRRYDQWAAEYE